MKLITAPIILTFFLSGQALCYEPKDLPLPPGSEEVIQEKSYEARELNNYQDLPLPPGEKSEGAELDEEYKSQLQDLPSLDDSQYTEEAPLELSKNELEVIKDIAYLLSEKKETFFSQGNSEEDCQYNNPYVKTDEFKRIMKDTYERQEEFFELQKISAPVSSSKLPEKKLKELLPSPICQECGLLSSSLLDVLQNSGEEIFTNPLSLNTFLKKIRVIENAASGFPISDSLMYASFILEEIAEHALRNGVTSLKGELVQDILMAITGDQEVPSFIPELLQSFGKVSFSKKRNGQLILKIKSNQRSFSPHYQVDLPVIQELGTIKLKREITIKIKKISKETVSQMAKKKSALSLNYISSSIRSALHSQSYAKGHQLGPRLFEIHGVTAIFKIDHPLFRRVTTKTISATIFPGILGQSKKKLPQAFVKIRGLIPFAVKLSLE